LGLGLPGREGGEKVQSEQTEQRGNGFKKSWEKGGTPHLEHSEREGREGKKDGADSYVYHHGHYCKKESNSSRGGSTILLGGCQGEVRESESDRMYEIHVPLGIWEKLELSGEVRRPRKTLGRTRVQQISGAVGEGFYWSVTYWSPLKNDYDLGESGFRRVRESRSRLKGDFKS